LVRVLGASPADGQGEDEALVQRGLEARRAGHDADALVLFQQAYALRATPRAQAQVALAEQALGQWLAAERDLRAALTGDDAWITLHRQSLQEALAIVSKNLGWLTVTCNAPGARAALDGVPLPAVPTDAPLRVVAGVARLRVEADGYVPVERSVRVDAEGRDDEVVLLSPVPAQPSDSVSEAAARPLRPISPATTPPYATPSTRREGDSWSLGVAFAGFAVVGLGVGTAFGLDTLRVKTERDVHCFGGRCDPRGLELDSRARLHALVSDSSFGVGAIALVTSAAVLLRAAYPARHVSFFPLLAPSSAGIFASEEW
jgi:hypothetical protein